MIDSRTAIVVAWKKNLYAIWLAELLALAGFSTSMPIIPFYLQSLGVKDQHLLKLWVGLIQSTASIALGLIAPVWGRLADLHGRRPMLLRAMLGGAVIIALMGFITQPWQLLVLRTIQGLLTGTVGAATVLVASTVPESELGYGMGLLQMSVFVGSSIGPMIGGFVADLVGYRFTFFVTASMLALAALIVSTSVREEFIPKKPEGGSFVRNLMPDFSTVFQSRTLLVLIAVAFTDQFSGSVVGPILPLYIQRLTTDVQRLATTTGLILGLGAFSAALTSAGVGRISYRIGYARTLIACLFGAAVMYLAQAFVATTGQLLVLRIVGGFFLGGTMPSVNALIARNTDRSTQGSVYGINTAVASAGAALGPALGATVAILWGFPAAFVLTALILAVTGSGVARVTRPSRRTAPR